MSEIKLELNPWQVSNIEDFLFYCCPECDLKTKDSKNFVTHAQHSHSKSKVLLNEVTKNLEVKTELESQNCELDSSDNGIDDILSQDQENEPKICGEIRTRSGKH